MMGNAILIIERDLRKDYFRTLARKVYYAQVLVCLRRYNEAKGIFNKVIKR